MKTTVKRVMTFDQPLDETYARVREGMNRAFPEFRRRPLGRADHEIIDRLSAALRSKDALLTVEDPNNPSPNPISSVDVGKVWTGVLQTLTSLTSDEARIKAVKMIADSLSDYANAIGCDLGWETDASGSTVASGGTPTTDGGKRAGENGRHNRGDQPAQCGVLEAGAIDRRHQSLRHRCESADLPAHGFNGENRRQL